MKFDRWFGVAVCFLALSLFAAPNGIVPRSAADKYAAHAENAGASIGATRVSDKQIHKTISPDVDDMCIVVEVGLYPARDGKLQVAIRDFALITAGEENAVNASSPAEIARKMPYYVTIGSGGGGTGAAVGQRPPVDSGNGGVFRDPVTGMPRPNAGVRVPNGTNAGVGVGGGASDADSSVSTQRHEIELKLTDKRLPEGETSAPVAGYLYFATEKKKGAKYQLEYKLNGKTVVLNL